LYHKDLALKSLSDRKKEEIRQRQLDEENAKTVYKRISNDNLYFGSREKVNNIYIIQIIYNSII